MEVDLSDQNITELCYTGTANDDEAEAMAAAGAVEVLHVEYNAIHAIVGLKSVFHHLVELHLAHNRLGRPHAPFSCRPSVTHGQQRGEAPKHMREDGAVSWCDGRPAWITALPPTLRVLDVSHNDLRSLGRCQCELLPFVQSHRHDLGNSTDKARHDGRLASLSRTRDHAMQDSVHDLDELRDDAEQASDDRVDDLTWRRCHARLRAQLESATAAMRVRYVRHACPLALCVIFPACDFPALRALNVSHNLLSATARQGRVMVSIAREVLRAVDGATVCGNGALEDLDLSYNAALCSLAAVLVDRRGGHCVSGSRDSDCYTNDATHAMTNVRQSGHPCATNIHEPWGRLRRLRVERCGLTDLAALSALRHYTTRLRELYLFPSLLSRSMLCATPAMIRDLMTALLPAVLTDRSIVSRRASWSAMRVDDNHGAVNATAGDATEQKDGMDETQPHSQPQSDDLLVAAVRRLMQRHLPNIDAALSERSTALREFVHSLRCTSPSALTGSSAPTLPSSQSECAVLASCVYAIAVHRIVPHLRRLDGRLLLADCVHDLVLTVQSILCASSANARRMGCTDDANDNDDDDKAKEEERWCEGGTSPAANCGLHPEPTAATRERGAEDRAASTATDNDSASPDEGFGVSKGHTHSQTGGTARADMLRQLASLAHAYSRAHLSREPRDDAQAECRGRDRDRSTSGDARLPWQEEAHYTCGEHSSRCHSHAPDMEQVYQPAVLVGAHKRHAKDDDTMRTMNQDDTSYHTCDRATTIRDNKDVSNANDVPVDGESIMGCRDTPLPSSSSSSSSSSRENYSTLDDSVLQALPTAAERASYAQLCATARSLYRRLAESQSRRRDTQDAVVALQCQLHADRQLLVDQRHTLKELRAERDAMGAAVRALRHRVQQRRRDVAYGTAALRAAERSKESERMRKTESSAAAAAAVYERRLSARARELRQRIAQMTALDHDGVEERTTNSTTGDNRRRAVHAEDDNGQSTLNGLSVNSTNTHKGKGYHDGTSKRHGMHAQQNGAAGKALHAYLVRGHGASPRGTQLREAAVRRRLCARREAEALHYSPSRFRLPPPEASRTTWARHMNGVAHGSLPDDNTERSEMVGRTGHETFSTRVAEQEEGTDACDGGDDVKQSNGVCGGSSSSSSSSTDADSNHTGVYEHGSRNEAHKSLDGSSERYRHDVKESGHEVTQLSLQEQQTQRLGMLLERAMHSLPTSSSSSSKSSSATPSARTTESTALRRVCKSRATMRRKFDRTDVRESTKDENTVDVDDADEVSALSTIYPSMQEGDGARCSWLSYMDDEDDVEMSEDNEESV